MIWVKRLAFLLILPLLWQGYAFYNRYRADQQEAFDRKYALVTAQIWLATAKFRSHPERYIEYRDSLLMANDLSPDQMFAYLQRNRQEPEQYHQYTVMVNSLVDSLYLIEDSLRKIADAESDQPDSEDSE